MATDKKLSTLVESQLPSFLLEEGPRLVAFVKAYYEWLETTGQATDALKNLIVNQDIDTTNLNQFYEYFKREVLSEFPDAVLTDKRLLTKRIKDLYRAKGTREAHRLLFRILFNEEIDFYDPSKNILKTSDGRWVKQSSIRLGTPFVGTLENLVNQIVTGQQSGASAKVESVTTTRESGVEVKELFLSEVSGTFLDLEIVANQNNSISGVIVNAVGPLKNVTIPDLRFSKGGSGHVRGDSIRFTSASGTGANGIVTSTNNRGTTFDIVNGGSGYRIGGNTVFTFVGGEGFDGTITVTSVSNTQNVFQYLDIIDDLKNTPIGFGPTFSANSGSVSANLASANAFTALSAALGTVSTTVGTINSISVLAGNYFQLPTVVTIDPEIAILELPDGNGGILGRNAVIVPRAIPGAIETVSVINGGVRYNAADPVTITNLSRTGTIPGEGNPVISGVVDNPGKYIDSKGFLSWDQYLQDGYYYQIFSYVINSNKALKSYRNIVNKIVHPAGTKFFGQVNIEDTLDLSAVIDSEIFISTNLVGGANGVSSILSTLTFGLIQQINRTLPVQSITPATTIGLATVLRAISPSSIASTLVFSSNNQLNFEFDIPTIASTLTFGNLNWSVAFDIPSITATTVVSANAFIEIDIDPQSVFATTFISTDTQLNFAFDLNAIPSTLIFSTPQVNFEFDVASITGTVFSSNNILLLTGDGTVFVSNNNTISTYLGQPITTYLNDPVVTVGTPFAVRGVNTFFTTTLTTGSTIEIQDNVPGVSGNTIYVVNTVFSNTNLTINTPFAGGNLISGIYRYSFTPGLIAPPISATLVIDLDASTYSGSGNWLDSTANNNDAVADGSPTFNSGGGDYFDLDGGSTTGPGTNDSFYVADDASLDTMTEMSVEMWVNIDSVQGTSTSPNVLYAKRTSSSNGYIGFFNASSYIFRAGTGTGTGFIATVTPTTGSWQHIIVTIGSGGSKLYINNVEVDTDAYTGTFGNIDTASQLRIGDVTDAVSGVFALDGKVGLFRIYDGILDSTDVNTRWNATKSRFGL